MNEQVNVSHDVPHGAYTVEGCKMELTESEKGDPMVTIWFKILEGDYKGSFIFMNQVITQGYPIHVVNTVLRAICEACSYPADVRFESYRQYGEMLMNIEEAVSGKEFALEYGEDRKSLPSYEIGAA